VLEDRRPSAHPWLARSGHIVLVRVIIELVGILRLGERLWLRQLAADDAPDVDNGFGDVIFEAHWTPHAGHRHVNEAVEPIPQQVESFRRVLDGEREEQPSRDLLELELLVSLGIGSKSVADIVIDGSDDTDPHLRPRDLAGEQAIEELHGGARYSQRSASIGSRREAL
jgi:hypothetical protein